jgi:hypothetical protein
LSRRQLRANAKKTDKIKPGFRARKKSSNRSLVEIDAEYRLYSGKEIPGPGRCLPLALPAYPTYCQASLALAAENRILCNYAYFPNFQTS